MDIYFSSFLSFALEGDSVAKHETHIISYKKLGLVLMALLMLTALTVAVSTVNMGPVNIWAALIIASCKATLVILFFMHMKYEPMMLKLSLIGTIFCVAMLIGFMFFDVAYR